MFVMNASEPEDYKVPRSLRFISSNSQYLQTTLVARTALGGTLATTYNLTIPSNTNNYVLYTEAKAAGYNGYSLCTVNLTINTGVIVGSSSSYLPALDLRGFPSGVVINITVGAGAYIVGAGGKGGNGGDSGWSMGSDGKFNRPGSPGDDGGDAIWASSYVTIVNNGTIAGGGGGGGGGAGVHAYGPGGGGGGGGAGLVAGSGGLAAGYLYGTNGSSGTFLLGGHGGPGTSAVNGEDILYSGDGGNGGDLGQPGASGGDSSWNDYSYTGAGGAAGNYIVGNSYVNWIATGTRLGGAASASTSKNWTISAWIKRGSLGSKRGIFSSGVNPYSTYAGENLYFDENNRLSWVNSIGNGSYNFWVTTNEQYRDPSAWYHVVAVCDITNTTQSERLRIYVNGVRQTLTANSGYSLASASTISRWNNTSYNQRIGVGYAGYFDGQFAEFHNIDGLSVDRTEFGKFDSKSGSWIPKKYRGSYGTYGFYLPFSDTTDTGTNSYYSPLGFDNKDKTVRYASTGVQSYTVPNYSTSLTIEVWGAGGGGGAGRVGYSGGGLGQASTATIASPHPIGSVTLQATGGLGGYPGFSVGTGGTASGGYVNTNGTNGSGNSGGSAPVGGGPGGLTSLNGAPGYQPGGGGAGGYDYGTGDGGGGGSGAYVRKTFAVGDLTPGQTIALFVGTGGAGDPAYPNQGTWSGGRGGDGMIQITVDGDIPTNWYPYNGFTSSTSSKDYSPLLDSPTRYIDGGNGRGNYCVLNTSYPGSSSLVSYGGLAMTSGRVGVGTIAVNSGKWYYEARSASSSATGYPIFGWHDLSSGFVIDGYPGAQSTNGCWGIGVGTYAGNLNLYVNNSGSYTYTTPVSSTFSDGDIIMIAFDASTGKFWAGKNGTWYASGDPANGTNPLATYTVSANTQFTPGASASDAGTCHLNFGQRPFTYTPPSGFKCLHTGNLPNTTLRKGSNYFNIRTRSGLGAANTQSGLSFSPDFVWVKARNATESHYLIDRVRGVNKSIATDTTNTQSTGNTVTAFNGDGYSLDSSLNINGRSYVDWIWRAGSGATVTNTAGTNGASLSSTYSVNTQGGFSIVTYTGTTAAGATVAHGLNAKPAFIICKALNASSNWPVYHKSLGATQWLNLNTVSGRVTSAQEWNNTEPTNTVFSLGGASSNSNKVANYVAYCWSEILGYSKFGSYVGNSSSDGPFIYCGFRPRIIIWKALTEISTGYTSWGILDTSNMTYNASGLGTQLWTNKSVQAGYRGEGTLSDTEPGNIDILSNGFKLRTSYVEDNNSSSVYIYAAFAETPFKYATAR